MASKRKRSVMSLEKKLDIITQIRQGRSQRAVADGFGVAKSTVGDIWKNREKIEIHVSASTNPAFAKKRCIVRDAHFHKLDEACYIWFQQQRAKGAPVSGPLLQEKALQLFPSFYPDEDESAFKASSGWLHKFCRRHGVRELSLQGEALSADTSAVEPFCQQLKNKIEEEGYSRCQIFYADETGLWWRLMPSKSLVDSGEKQARNFKKPKDRVTVLGCANASGTCKVPLAFIHKSAKPRCFNSFAVIRKYIACTCVGVHLLGITRVGDTAYCVWLIVFTSDCCVGSSAPMVVHVLDCRRDFEHLTGCKWRHARYIRCRLQRCCTQRVIHALPISHGKGGLDSIT